VMLLTRKTIVEHRSHRKNLLNIVKKQCAKCGEVGWTHEKADF
jgi:hypothetical protein